METTRPFAASVMKVAANETIRMIDMQAHRVRSTLPEDDHAFFGEAEFRRDADYVLFAFALWRLREIAAAVQQHLAAVAPDSDATQALGKAHTDFRSELPELNQLRHLTTHVGDYAAGLGRDRTVHPGELYVGEYINGVRPVARAAVDVDIAVAASESLYLATIEALSATTPDSGPKQ